jgi:hypothetical protein
MRLGGMIIVERRLVNMVVERRMCVVEMLLTSGGGCIEVFEKQIKR